MATASYRLILATLALVATAITGPGPQHALAQGRPLDKSTFVTLQFDNDIFSGTDRHFTNGMRAAWLSGEGDGPALVRDTASKLPLFSGTDRMRFSFSIGQDIFTPKDISLQDPPTSERPYAGWLFAGIGLVAEHGPRLDKLELDIGVIGPYSFAEQTQTQWHRLIGISTPEGWETQLETEPGFALYYERSQRALLELPLADVTLIQDLGVDFTPHWGIALGNVFTYGAAGFTLRFGDDLPNDFGPPKIRPNLPGSDFFIPDDFLGWYVFAGAEGRLVARNIFLDGNTFRDSRSVDKSVVVGDFQVGFAVTFWRARLALTQAFRSKEFSGQDGFDAFGSAALTMRF